MLKSLYRKFILFLMESWLYEKIVLHVVPFIRFSTYYVSFKGTSYYKAEALLREGDILLSTDKEKLSSVLVPGEWDHAALCVSTKNPFQIAEMTHKGFTKSHLFDFCKTSSRIAILRCSDFDKNYVNDVLIPETLKLDGTPYDVSFELGIKTLYCSELIYVVDKEKRLKVSLDDLIGIGRPYLSPQGLRNAKNVELIFDSKND